MKAILTVALLALCVVPLRGGIPEPDNIVYGQIWVGTNVVTAERTNLFIEVRHSNDMSAVSTNVVASYHMGQNPALANFYAVEIPLWTDQGTVIPMTGSNLIVRVTERVIVGAMTNYYPLYTTNFVVGNRGYIARIDFAAMPTNVVSGFEAWAAYYGLQPGSGALDADRDGMSNYKEYVAGTKPDNDLSQFRVEVSGDQPAPRVSFDALRAEGVGYEGHARYYTLESVGGLESSTWEGVPGYSNILGANQLVEYTVLGTNRFLFYRAKVWLETAK